MITKQYRELTMEEVVYTAGFFDGEGCIYIYCNSKRRSQQLFISLASTYYPILRKLQDIWNIGSIQLYLSRNGHSPCWGWHLTCNDALRMLECIYPYLCIKKRRAELAILYQRWTSVRGKARKLPPEIQLDKDVYEAMRYFNQRPPPQDIKLPVFDTLQCLNNYIRR